MVKFGYVHVLLILAANCVLFVSASAADQPVIKPKQFIYVLRLVPRLYEDASWTDADKMALNRHFARFQHSIETGELILAGRTTEPGNETFGIAIFEANDEAAARAFMESDPAVVAGLMTAELHPFAVALQRNRPKIAPRCFNSPKQFRVPAPSTVREIKNLTPNPESIV